MNDVWIVLALLGGIFVGWMCRSYLGTQFMNEFHAMHQAGRSVEEAVERANAHIEEKQKYVAWGLGLFIVSFVAVILLLKVDKAENMALQNSFRDADQNPGATKEGITDAMKDLGFKSK